MGEAQKVKHIRERSRQIILGLLTIGLLFPFLTKAYHIDDPLFIWSAQHIVKNPFDFYGFSINWYGTLAPMSTITKNPPLFSYWLALFGAIAGWREWVLHGASFVFSIGALLAVYRIAKQIGGRPFFAALLTLGTPVFFISATTVMCDVPMVCLWMWSLSLWVSGERENKRMHLWGAAVLMGLATLTKYFAFSALPMIAIYSIMVNRKITWRLAVLAVPVLMVFGYQWVTWKLYGIGLFADAASYVMEHKETTANPQIILRGLMFIGGCLLPAALFCFDGLRRKKVLLQILFCGIGAGLLAYMHGKVDGIVWIGKTGLRWGLVFSAWVFMFASLALIIQSLISEYNRPGKPEKVLLSMWFFGTILFSLGVNWSINGRSLLPLAPAIALVLSRRRADVPKKTFYKDSLCFTLAFGVSFMVAWSDKNHADSARYAAKSIAAHFEGQKGRTCFQGHWGFQYYMEQRNTTCLDILKTSLQTGDRLVVPQNNTNVHEQILKRLQEGDCLVVGKFPWLTCMQGEMYAGFYSDAFGGFPYVVGKAPPERYFVYQVAKADPACHSIKKE